MYCTRAFCRAATAWSYWATADFRFASAAKVDDKIHEFKTIYLLEDLSTEDFLEERTDRIKKKSLIKCLKSLKELEETGDYLFYMFPPLMVSIFEMMRTYGLEFNFRNSCAWTMGGGWIMTQESFRDKLFEYFGISPDKYVDIYGATESDVVMMQCEGHYYHIPHSVLYPFIFDEGM